jgi:hypothetical protein
MICPSSLPAPAWWWPYAMGMIRDTIPAPGSGPAGLCAGCRHQGDSLPAGRCRPGDACVRAESGRQIDRFFLSLAKLPD